MKKFNDLREETLEEKLKASDPTGKWIHDFVHSDNPKFAGKSKKERIRMALGAAYGAKKTNEDLTEEKPGLWDNIHAKRKRIEAGSGERMRKPGSKGAPSAQDFKDAAKTSKNEAVNPAQQAAIDIAMKKKGQKPKNESIEEEIKTTHKDPLVTVHHTDGELWTHANLSVANAIHRTNVSHKDVHAGPVKSGKWTFGISKHHATSVQEDTEQLDELSPATLQSYKVAGHKKFDSIRNNTDSSSMAKKSKLEKGIKTAHSKQYPAPKSTPAPKADPNSKGYEQGRYMGDSVEQDTDKQIDELKSSTYQSYVDKVADPKVASKRGNTKTGVPKSIKAIGGVTKAIGKQNFAARLASAASRNL